MKKKTAAVADEFEIKTEIYHADIVLTSEMLGTVPKSKEIYAKYIASKTKVDANAGQEIESVEDSEEAGWTGFHTDDQGIFIYDYMIKGFLKSACEAMMAGGYIKKITAYKKWFDLMVFIRPRQIRLQLEPDGVLERPIRAMTAKGPVVSLKRSDLVNPGKEISFDIELLPNSKGIDHEIIRKILLYGKFVGLGQWRGSGGYGQFELDNYNPK